jgi:hypothetical protein
VAERGDIQTEEADAVGTEGGGEITGERLQDEEGVKESMN